MSVYSKEYRVHLAVLSNLLRGEPENLQNFKIMNERNIYSILKERKDNYEYLFMLLDIRNKERRAQS